MPPGAAVSRNCSPVAWARPSSPGHGCEPITRQYVPAATAIALGASTPPRRPASVLGRGGESGTGTRCCPSRTRTQVRRFSAVNAPPRLPSVDGGGHRADLVCTAEQPFRGSPRREHHCRAGEAVGIGCCRATYACVCIIDALLMCGKHCVMRHPGPRQHRDITPRAGGNRTARCPAPGAGPGRTLIFRSAHPRAHTRAVLPTVKTGPTGLDNHYSPVS